MFDQVMWNTLVFIKLEHLYSCWSWLHVFFARSDKKCACLVWVFLQWKCIVDYLSLRIMRRGMLFLFKGWFVKKDVWNFCFTGPYQLAFMESLLAGWHKSVGVAFDLGKLENSRELLFGHLFGIFFFVEDLFLWL